MLRQPNFLQPKQLGGTVTAQRKVSDQSCAAGARLKARFALAGEGKEEAWARESGGQGGEVGSDGVSGS